MSDRTTTRKILRIIAISAFVGLIIVYIAYRSRDVRQGPVLTIETPLEGTLTDTPLVTVAGTAKNTTLLTVNGSEIFLDEFGVFSHELLVLPGYSIIEIEATDKFGKMTSVVREVIYPAPFELPDTSYPLPTAPSVSSEPSLTDELPVLEVPNEE